LFRLFSLLPLPVDIYQSLLRPLLFSGLKTDPEWLHVQSLHWLDQLQSLPDAQRLWLLGQIDRSLTYRSAQPGPSRLSQSLWGVHFANPIGLAAGFDKNGMGAGIWQHFGFGFAELGTVTRHAQPGNPTPRLFRLPADRAVLNRMGFNNSGAAALADRLLKLQARSASLAARLEASSDEPGAASPAIPIGLNLGKSKITPLEEAAEDYAWSFERLQRLGHYIVVNVSSPNTPGLRSLQSTEQLTPILARLQALNTDRRPILVKIAPDLAWDDIAAVIDLAQSYNLAGLIATNTTISREGLVTDRLSNGGLLRDEAGGISGAPLRDRSTAVIRYIWQRTQGQLPIIGVGGIFTADDAWAKITAGASLLQTYSGWIYEGPWMVRRILSGLEDQLDRHGFQTIQEAIGSAADQT
jgi:dihydroorotate dehydrogenase